MAFIACLVGISLGVAGEGQHYLLSDYSKLVWDSELELVPNFMPKEQGTWFEGNYQNKEFAVWVSRADGHENKIADAHQSWKQIIDSNKRITGKEILNLGCKNLTDKRLLCERTEKEIVDKDGKKATQYARIKMIWNDKTDLIILRTVSFVDEALLAQINGKVRLEFNEKGKIK